MIGLVDQLRDTGTADLIEGGADRSHLQRLQMRLQIGCGAEGGRASRIRLVLPGSLTVLGGEADRFEVARRQQRAGEQRGIGRQLRDCDLRQRRTYLGALGRIVIQQHQRIDTDVESGRDGLEV